MNVANFEIIIEPLGIRGKFTRGLNLLEISRQMGIEINSLCGGVGKCKSCRVRLLSGTGGQTTSPEKVCFSVEELKDNWRLACQVVPLSDCTVFIPPETLSTAQRLQTEGLSREIPLDPAVVSFTLELPKPSLTDARSVAFRLTATCEKTFNRTCRAVDFQVLKTLAADLHQWDWKTVLTLYGSEVIALQAPESRQVGLAVDVGTTKIAAYLLDLKTGKMLASRGVINPQISFGEDIISRLNVASRSEDAAQKLHSSLISSIQGLAETLCSRSGINAQSIMEAVMVGNTAIHHLLLGLPVKHLGQAPYTAVMQERLAVKARDIGFGFAPGAYVQVLPNIAGFVGADFVSTLLAAGAFEKSGLTLVLDIGTNTEVALVESEHISCVSCASGPAFEGWHISHGMRAASGAIERIYIADGVIKYQTIDNVRPLGICGSGIVDALSQMYLNGIIDQRGTLQKTHPLVQSGSGQLEMEIVPGGVDTTHISVSQQDIREIQSAKSAIRTGIQILLEQTQHLEEDIEEVLTAGAFGSYIDVESAIEIGLLPPLKRERISQIGNAAGAGARYTLLSAIKRQEAESIVRRANYIELATVANFMRVFGLCHYLGKYVIRKGKRLVLD